MKSKTIHILLSIVITVVSAWFLLKPNYSYYKTEIIRGKNLQVVIYVQNNFSHFGFSSQNGHKLAYIELQNLDGNTLAKQSLFNRCEVLIEEINPFVENNKLYFTKLSYINLLDYSYYCF
ncbi:hypothetical protein AX016_1189 [Cellulophaga sp. RHA19]|uniref:hypothetical protein n=1 Tax=Cellulophaga sp. RHA19 TaxID=1798237 RepID=UPI000C2CCBAC|nr:hypothetical protein [Cellulophaga sp. RHA19]PKB43009.1 hypothetical protein AX016_1189 [Cellulophaga sp. RHA19]